jgi:pSer/pThr/pTyr-binding forkhead associated (FHA) protein
MQLPCTTDDSGSLVVTCRDTSTNGTFLDGVKIQKDVEMPMYDGTVITLPCDETKEDIHTFHVSIGGAPGEDAQVNATSGGTGQRFGGIPYYEGGAGSSRFAGLGIGGGGTSVSLPATQSEMERERQRAGTIASTVGEVCMYVCMYVCTCN